VGAPWLRGRLAYFIEKRNGREKRRERRCGRDGN